MLSTSMRTGSTFASKRSQNPAKATFGEDDFDDDDEFEEHDVKFVWSNLMFIPFNTVFRLLVLCCVIGKTVMGPLSAITPELYCITVRNDTAITVLSKVKPYFSYICDPLYFIDTFLHIVHKQVEDKAKQREHLPKSSGTILLDIISLIPFFRLLSFEECGEITLWPNILTFNEFVLIYRVIDFFTSGMKHSVINNIIGFFLIGIIGLNAVTCFWILLTYEGFCKQCHKKMIDWRLNIKKKLDALPTEEEKYFFTYFSANGYLTSIVLQTTINNIRPMLIREMLIVDIFTAMSYFLIAFFVVPKLFAECCQRNSKQFNLHRNMVRIMKDTFRRNPDPSVVDAISNYFHLIWTKRSGITKCPSIIRQLPRYLSVEIKEDLCWPLFYHSPTLRRTSVPFKRWICDYIKFEYKMPGEIFFPYDECLGKLYYIKSGIVQIISSDDGVTPLLSVAGGTLLGDVNFYVPALERKNLVRCLTYCEVYCLQRRDIYIALEKFKKDRTMIMYKVKQRLKHARDLFALKNKVRGIDRNEDENINWVKMRWWKLLQIINHARKKASAMSDVVSFDIPPEESIYHCSKYLGQLVLCTDEQLQNKSTFVTAHFPWIFVPDSTFAVTWHRIVIFTVYMVLFIYPPNLMNRDTAFWFTAFEGWVDFIYIMDIILMLLTAPSTKNEDLNFTVVMFTRCKDVNFLLHILATPILNEIVRLSGLKDYLVLSKFNKLIKIYILFKSTCLTKQDLKESPLIQLSLHKTVMYFSFTYVSCFFVFILCFKSDLLSHMPFFCYEPKPDRNQDLWLVITSWIRESTIHIRCLPTSYHDIYVLIALAMIGFSVKIHTRANMIGAFYLRNVEYIKYQSFVSQFTSKYEVFKSHPSLLKRLNKYLQCHWLAYGGLDLMCNDLLHNVPYQAYWKSHGEKALEIIKKSSVFLNSDEEMLKELAFKARFGIYPKNSVLYLYGCPFDKVAWMSNGYLACEYQDLEGNPIKRNLERGEIISIIAVFFGKFSIRTFIATTDVEILYIKKRDFYDILKRYPQELQIIKTVSNFMQPAFDNVYRRHVNDVNQTYQSQIRRRIFERDQALVHHESVLWRGDNTADTKSLLFFLQHKCWIHPQSRYYHGFLLFRVICIFLTIIFSSVQAGGGAFYSRIMWKICEFNDYITYMDMIFKLFLAHYDHKGLLIYHWKKRFLYYFSHSFAVDLIGSVPWYSVTNYLIPRAMNQTEAHFFNTVYRCAHIYLINGYFNYFAYWPTANLVYIMIIKWHLILILLIITAAQFYMIRCVDIRWKNSAIVEVLFTNNTCWMSRNSYIVRPNLEGRNLTVEEVQEIFAESLLIATHSLLRASIGRFHFKDTRSYLLIAISGLIGVVYWFIMTYIISLLVLNSRGISIFLDSIKQLENFLKGERIEKKFIDAVVDHYKYVWFRTKGVSIQIRLIDSIGSILRQDLSYFLYKRTIEILDSQLNLGRSLKWILSFYCDQLYFLEKADIMRENDVVNNVYIVHRGVVTIFHNRKRIATLKKGSIFGQLESTKLRPIKVTATASDDTDVLTIPWMKFHELLTHKAKISISKERTHVFDYIGISASPAPDPYNSIRYLLRGCKTMSFPWMKLNTCTIKTSKWLSMWLILAWLIEPNFSAGLSIMTVLSIPDDVKFIIVWCLIVADIICLIQVVSDYFYSMELVIYGGHAVYKYNRLRKLRHWGLYVDIMSLLIPNTTIYFNIWWFQLARLLRLRLFYLFYQQFVVIFQSNTKPTIIFFFIVVQVIHIMSCMYIYFACQHPDGFYYLPNYMQELLDIYLDNTEWTTRLHRKLGCPCLMRERVKNRTSHYAVRSKTWYGDYLVAISGIIQTKSLFSFQPDLGYFKHESALMVKALVNLVLATIDILIISKAISVITIKYRKLHKYDKAVTELMTFLTSEGLSPTLQEIVNTYMNQLWDRQRGNWLPELAFQAPQCLREDIMGTLYIHHLQKPPIFHDIPNYFMRQLVSRFHRVVIFPGKYIVRAGDILPRLYFIHEGDVEKHYVNSKGEIVTTHLLSTNGYFGFIPGMPKDMPFTCSYLTRTVVDAVYIKISEWKDLLDVYDDVKTYLNDTSKALTTEL